MKSITIANVRRAMAGAALTVLCAGCATAPRGNLAAPDASTSLPPPTQPVTLTAGDELDIKFYYAPELNERQTIRPDGMISLQLVGDIKAAGLTPSGLEKRLEEEFKNLIERNEVSIIVRRLCYRVVYVGGAVLRPRAVEMPGNLTVLAAVMEAGGIDYRTAAPEHVMVLRETPEGYRPYEINLEETFEGRQQAPFYLHPRDIVYVARSRIADVNQWIEQYINRMVPQFGFTYRHTSGTSSYGIDTSN